MVPLGLSASSYPSLFDGDDTKATVNRVYQLQCFREEYKILDSVADGRRCLEAYLDLMPGLHLTFAADLTIGTTVMVYDNTKFDDSGLRSEEAIRTVLGGSYYTLSAFAPDLEAIRRGTTLVVECEGYNWKAHADIKYLKTIWSEIASVYPVNISKANIFNTGTMMNTVLSMLKPILPAYLPTRLEFDCQFDQLLDQIYLMPSLEVANERMMDRFTEAPRRRYENEKTFNL